MLGLTALSLVLMWVDHLTGYLDDARAALSLVVTPVVVAADLPGQTVSGVQKVFATREEMARRIDVLESELLLLRAKTEKMATLSVENNRLRALLGSASKVEDNVLVAELIGVDPDPRRHYIIIDKGTNQDVYVGQPVLDAEGLMGQVVEAGPLTSRVLLISDPTHAVPVQVVRSNLRLIAQGTGASGQLELMHVQETADIKEGDLLVSSGLGGRFPVGYPVGVVAQRRHDPGEPFVEVTAVPSARLDRTRHVLLVFTDEAPIRHEEGIDGRSG